MLDNVLMLFKETNDEHTFVDKCDNNDFIGSLNDTKSSSLSIEIILVNSLVVFSWVSFFFAFKLSISVKVFCNLLTSWWSLSILSLIMLSSPFLFVFFYKVFTFLLWLFISFNLSSVFFYILI